MLQQVVVVVVVVVSQSNADALKSDANPPTNPLVGREREEEENNAGLLI